MRSDKIRKIRRDQINLILSGESDEIRENQVGSEKSDEIRQNRIRSEKSDEIRQN
jgi:hypothetical protein